mmetsp:Transcript_9141/g.21789  ORF Transcript_9141/g.21789 Transcript_9141/m.21789 type:complete len:523 (-) Transcript_9141:1241-2809(-)
MPKTKKRSRRKDKAVANLNFLSNLTGFGDASSDSLDRCLEAFNLPQPSKSNEESGKGRIQKPVAKNADVIGWISSVERQNRLNPSVIESWNQSILLWLKGGNYPPALLPNIEAEIARNFAVRELSSFLLQAGNDLRMPVFERWLLDSRLEQTLDAASRSPSDPVLPHQVTLQSDASQRLVQELSANIKDEKKAESIVSELCRKTNFKSRELTARSELYRRQSSLKRAIITVEKNSSEVTTILYAKKKWKKPFCYRVNTEHYERLRVRFFAVHNTATKTKLDSKDARLMRAYNVVVISLLIRYDALSGGFLNDDLRGGGMQGAVHSEVFSVLQNHFSGSFMMEGFASPLNHYLPSFCSAFPDIEWHFGSMGSFMESRFTHDACCELNPPFSPGLMMQMSVVILQELKAAKNGGMSLTFVIVVPTARGDTTADIKQFANDSFQRMVTSPYCKKHIVLESRTHGYIEGAAHLRPTRYKESNYDTSVIFLQSQDLPSVDYTQLEREIRDSFASRHRQETQMRRSLN